MTSTTGNRAAHGFTLIEILVAVIILAGGAIFVSQALAHLAHGVNVTQERAAAYSFAAAKLAEMEHELKYGKSPTGQGGSFQEGGKRYIWQITAAEDPSDPERQLMMLTVDWDGGRHSYESQYALQLDALQPLTDEADDGALASPPPSIVDTAVIGALAEAGVIATSPSADGATPEGISVYSPTPTADTGTATATTGASTATAATAAAASADAASETAADPIIIPTETTTAAAATDTTAAAAPTAATTDAADTASTEPAAASSDSDTATASTAATTEAATVEASADAGTATADASSATTDSATATDTAAGSATTDTATTSTAAETTPTASTSSSDSTSTETASTATDASSPSATTTYISSSPASTHASDTGKASSEKSSKEKTKSK